MTTQDTDRPRNTHGGRRPGAGAPRGNVNALRAGHHSPRHKDAIIFISLIPELRQRWLDLLRIAESPGRLADSQGTLRGPRERQRRARYHMQVMLDAAAAVISPRNYILGFVAEVARERLEPPTPWRVRKHALMALKVRAAPDERAQYIIAPLGMIRDDAPDLAKLLFQPLLADFDAREAALLKRRRVSVAAGSSRGSSNNNAAKRRKTIKHASIQIQQRRKHPRQQSNNQDTNLPVRSRLEPVEGRDQAGVEVCPLTGGKCM
jgi:hypothetical protein